jgi:hypothetical protein
MSDFTYSFWCGPVFLTPSQDEHVDAPVAFNGPTHKDIPNVNLDDLDKTPVKDIVVEATSDRFKLKPLKDLVIPRQQLKPEEVVGRSVEDIMASVNAKMAAKNKGLRFYE